MQYNVYFFIDNVRRKHRSNQPIIYNKIKILSMKNYLISLVIVALCTGITEFMIPERIANGIKSNIKLIGSLCTICILIAPILPIINKYGRIENYIEKSLDFIKSEYNSKLSELGNNFDICDENEIYKDALLFTARESVEKYIVKQLNDKFDIKTENCKIRIEFSEDMDGYAYVSKITIILKGADVWKNPYEIEKYFEDKLSFENSRCKCTVRSSN